MLSRGLRDEESKTKIITYSTITESTLTIQLLLRVVRPFPPCDAVILAMSLVCAISYLLYQISHVLFHFLTNRYLRNICWGYGQ